MARRRLTDEEAEQLLADNIRLIKTNINRGLRKLDFYDIMSYLPSSIEAVIVEDYADHKQVDLKQWYKSKAGKVSELWGRGKGRSLTAALRDAVNSHVDVFAIDLDLRTLGRLAEFCAVDDLIEQNNKLAKRLGYK